MYLFQLINYKKENAQDLERSFLSSKGIISPLVPPFSSLGTWLADPTQTAELNEFSGEDIHIVAAHSDSDYLDLVKKITHQFKEIEATRYFVTPAIIAFLPEKQSLFAFELDEHMRLLDFKKLILSMIEAIRQIDPQKSLSHLSTRRKLKKLFVLDSEGLSVLATWLLGVLWDVARQN